MPSIQQNIELVTSQLPKGVRLVAVSKYHPVEKLQEAYDAGQRIFGESRAQELVSKCPQLPDDIEWHFIGHLQTNKARMIMPNVTLIHAIDSIKLLKVVNKEAARIGRTVDTLLQLHVAQETTKSGFTVDELLKAETLRQLDDLDLGNVRIGGLMAMATNTSDHAQVAKEFGIARSTFDALKAGYFAGNDYFKELSMGMSHDWRIAVDQGSTMIRIGTDLFGEREY